MRATAVLYVPLRGTLANMTDKAATKLPTILALHPTSPSGSAWSEVRLPPLNYAAELAARGYVVIAPEVNC